MTAISVSNDNDPALEESPLSSSFTRDGITVEVKIHRLARGDRSWILAVGLPNGEPVVWEERFATDAEAYRAFYLTVEYEGIDTVLRPEQTRR